ncbi:MAG: SpoIID/LytB domain-containing protein [Synechococcales bacterium]|nr:SpoIID/LytB domain-containing protein [Synechococcales bacterium]
MTAIRCQSSHPGSIRSFLQLQMVLKFVEGIGLPRSTPRPRWRSALLGLIAFIGLLLPAASVRALELRVAIEEQTSQIQLGSSTQATLKNGAGQVVAQIPAGGGFVAQATGGQVVVSQWRDQQFWVEPSDNGYVFIDDKWYRGRTQVVATGSGLTAINVVDLEHYLYSVVGSEMPTNWPLEALKAQAVTARTYVLYKRQRGTNPLFDVGDTTTWQVYGGLAKEASTTQAAVEATRGQVLTHNGQLIEAVFHSSSGGHTENVEDIWSSPRPYLRGVVDFDQGAPVFQWMEQVSAADLRQKISGVGNVLSMTPEQTTPRGRIVTMRVTGDTGSRVIRGDELRRALGLRSTLFTVTPQFGRVASAGNVASAPTVFFISGRGFGHGVGMSQWGAYGMAAHGYNYQQILGHYYQGVGLSNIQVQ